MAERKHNLPSGYDRLGDQVRPPVADSIVVYPRSHGVLSLPGQHSTERPHPRHDTKVTAAGPDGYYLEQVMRGSAERYTVTYDVWNHRDSPIFAEIVMLDDQEQGEPAQ
jgi:hypothetical protein